MITISLCPNIDIKRDDVETKIFILVFGLNIFESIMKFYTGSYIPFETF